MIWIVSIGIAVVVAIAIYDLTQRQHAILRNFPILGHFRYLLEAVGPELRQYIVTDNNEERPFSRDQAALDLRVGKTREQLLRVWLRQRNGTAAGIGNAMVVLRAMLLVGASVIAGFASPPQRVFPDSRAIVDFQRALDAYAFLHRQVERRVGVSADQRAMAAGMRAARPSPQEGEIFIPLVATAFRHRIAVALESDGCEMPQRNRQNFEVPRPNGDASMASAIPECVSAMLPRLPEELMYRAVGSRLVLVDTHAALVVDVVPSAFPE